MVGLLVELTNGENCCKKDVSVTGYLVLAGQLVQHVFVGECVERALFHHFFEDSVDNAGQLDLVGQVGVDSGVSKVWSLTQFYSVDFSQSV